MSSATPALPSSSSAARPHGHLAEVCGEIAAVFRRTLGRGPTRASAQWAGQNTLVVLLHGGLTAAEQTLRAAGRAEELLRSRHLLQSILETELKETVERILDRPVEAVVGAARLDPDVSVEIFLMSPAHASPAGESGKVRMGAQPPRC